MATVPFGWRSAEHVFLNGTDLYVVVPGILGSTLAREENGKLVPVWSPSLGGVVEAIKSFGTSVRSLQLPADIGDDEPGDGVVATELFPDIHIVPGLWSFNLGYSRLVTFLKHEMSLTEVACRDGPANLLLFAYDWRLSNRVSGRKLAEAIRKPLGELRKVNADAKVQLICHSMGGLVARWYIAYEGGAADVRRLITIGTPHRGALTALDQLVNGPTRTWWKFTIKLKSLHDFVRSLPSVYQLLPQYACIGDADLKKLTETSVPDLHSVMLNDAVEFHKQLDDRPPESRDLRFYPLVGIRQSTPTTALISGGKVVPSQYYHGEELDGDGTVPRLAGFPSWFLEDNPSIKWSVNHHGALVHDLDIFGSLDGILTASPIAYPVIMLRRDDRPKAFVLVDESHKVFGDMSVTDLSSNRAYVERAAFGLSAPPVVAPHEPLLVSVSGLLESPLVVRVEDTAGSEVTRQTVPPGSGDREISLPALPRPGAYVITASVERPWAHSRPVTTMTVVWDEAASRAQIS